MQTEQKQIVCSKLLYIYLTRINFNRQKAPLNETIANSDQHVYS